MLTLFILAPIFAVILVVHLIKRLLFGSFGYRRHHHCGFGGYNRGFYPRRHFGFGGIGSILLLVALERFFDRRY